MKRKLLILSAVAICLATLASGTLAYYTSEERAHNVITSGGVDITLLEWADEERQTPFVDLEGMMPGQDATKIVEVCNTGVSEAWIRIRYNVYIDDGEPYDSELVKLDLNTDDWTYNEDDCWYYYNTPVQRGDTTKPLFTTVHFETRMGNGYQNRKFRIDVDAQAVQTANNGESATEAQGWPAWENE